MTEKAARDEIIRVMLYAICESVTAGARASVTQTQHKNADGADPAVWEGHRRCHDEVRMEITPLPQRSTVVGRRLLAYCC